MARPQGSSDGWLPPEDGTLTREQYYRNREAAPPPPATRKRTEAPRPPTTGASSSPTRSQKSKPAASTTATSLPRVSESTRAPSVSSPLPPVSPVERRTVRKTWPRVPAPPSPAAKAQRVLASKAKARTAMAANRVERPDPLTVIREKGEVPECQACDGGVPADWVYRLPPEPNWSETVPGSRPTGKPGERLTLCGRHAAIAVKAYVGGTLIPGEAVWGDAA